MTYAKSKWAVTAVMVGSAALARIADSVPASGPEQLVEIVVTGSLIPQARLEASTPLTVITAEDLHARGFSNVAAALQQASFSTGSIQNAQFTDGFTPGAQTLSMFGLSPGYVKYLIDGRPISDYPALYNASEVFTNISGIPESLVDHIDILPGGQSSLYGSDAIAGVINISLKKHLDAPVIDARYGFYNDGGGVDKRIAVADSFQSGSLKLLAGASFETTTPIYGYQRDLTASYYMAGVTPVTAERDYLVYNGDGQYYFLDPANCGNVVGQFGGSTRHYNRPRRGDYCGTQRAGFYTLGHADETVQAYLHATDDLSEGLQLYGDLLLNHDSTRFNRSLPFWTTENQYGAYYDPNLDDFVNLQHILSPEEVGGLPSVMNKLFTNSYEVSAGLHGSVLFSRWTYDISLARGEQKLTRRNNVVFNAPFEDFFASLLGRDLGPDPYGAGYPTFAPDYGAFYKPLTPAQYASFSGYIDSRAQTAHNEVRTQLTNAQLFPLRGGNAGVAIVAEAGNQQWSYVPDPRYLDGEIFGYTAVTGAGHRSRYAATSELRLPLLEFLMFSTSGRFDSYSVANSHVDKFTYNVGLELRPLQTLMIRARYGTAFKAASLSDEFQGRTNLSDVATDYYRCAQGGYSGATLGNCPFYGEFIQTVALGSPRLKPVTAKVWDAGLVWTPIEKLSFSADYLHWGINNEVAIQSADEVTKTESLCRLGTYDVSSPTCGAAIAQVTRDGTGDLAQVFTPKINVSQEVVNAVTLSLSYGLPMGRFGTLAFDASWTDMLRHVSQQYFGDPLVDLRGDPTRSTDFKTKANASACWMISSFASTVYVNRVGKSPNFIATTDGYGAPGAADLHPWTLVNWSAQYQWSRALRLSLTADNVFNSMPPADHSYAGIDYFPFNSDNYDVYGRSYLLEATYEWRP